MTERFPRHLRCERSNSSRARLFRTCDYDFNHKIQKSKGRTLSREYEDYLSAVKAKDKSYKKGNTIYQYKDVQIGGENLDKK